MFRDLKRLLSDQSKSAHRGSHQRSRRLGMESLESREMMIAGLAAAGLTAFTTQPLPQTVPAEVTVSIQNNDLVIHGTNGKDDVTVSFDGTKYTVKVVTYLNNYTAVTKESTWRPTGGDVFFYGYNGNDKFSANNTTLRVTAYGGDGNDQLTGSGANDNLNGGNGNDTLHGGPGNDKLNGDAGDDLIYGGNHDDVINGGTGADKIYGENGNDVIDAGEDYAPNIVYGGYGHDRITGGLGNGKLYGEAGSDALYGLLGSDELYGGEDNDLLDAGMDYLANFLDGGNGHDELFGSFGNDHLLGGAGNDHLEGYAGNDKLEGGSGYDFLYGGDGDDYLNGGSDDSSDSMYGQAGNDTFVVEVDFGFQLFYKSKEYYDAEPGEIVYKGT